MVTKYPVKPTIVRKFSIDEVMQIVKRSEEPTPNITTWLHEEVDRFRQDYYKLWGEYPPARYVSHHMTKLINLVFSTQ